jgi:transcriptional regulator with XRE-family HTH domain
MVDMARYRKMFEEAETSADYWTASPIFDFTEDLCRLMKEQGVSRAELARRIGTSRAYITRLLGGSANFTLGTMVKLAMALDGVVRIHIADKRAITSWSDKPRRRAKSSGDSKRPAKARTPSAKGSGKEKRQG